MVAEHYIPIRVNGRLVQYPNQDMPSSVMTTEVYDYAVNVYLPQLVDIHAAIESATGIRWYPTSYMRQSPSHRNGSALDLAPDIQKSSVPYYSAFNASDPVLYARTPLIKQLRQVALNLGLPRKWGLFVENDHIHIGLFKTRVPGSYQGEVSLWGSPKATYPDSDSRMASFSTEVSNMM